MVTRSTVSEVVRYFGGVRKCSVVADCTMEQIYQARARGRFLQAAVVLRLTAALHPDDPAQQLAVARQLAGINP